MSTALCKQATLQEPDCHRSGSGSRWAQNKQATEELPRPNGNCAQVWGRCTEVRRGSVAKLLSVPNMVAEFSMFQINPLITNDAIYVK